jgi:sulfhydrogenase subunit alpha
MAKQINLQNIHIDYLSRVEGETSVIVKLGRETPEEIRLNIFEAPRFFEGFLVGRRYDEVGDIVSRICGICPISHMTTALQAVEDAMGIVTSPRTKKLRRLMCIAQMAASHIIHLYMLALPDYHDHPGFLTMVPEFGEQAKNFILMKEAVNAVGEHIGGRPLHPISMVVNGFTKLPSHEDLETLAAGIERVLPLARETATMISALPCPDLRSDSLYFALRKHEEFAINDGRLVSSSGIDADVHDYPGLFKEEQVPYAMAKKSFTREGSHFMVGALARMNLKFDQYHQDTKSLARELGINVPDTNPFHNNLAQALEIHEGMLESLDLLSDIKTGKEDSKFEVREGEGMAVTEAPRGLLMHHYAVNKRGFIEKADLRTPTSHNFASMEKDLRLLAHRFSQEDESGSLRLKCEKLIRAYDPCFSCSVH